MLTVVVLPLVQIYSQNGEHAAALGLLSRLAPENQSANERELRRTALKQTGREQEFHRELMAFGRERQRLLLSLLKPDQRKSLYEIVGVPEELAREAFRLAAAKLPLRTTFVSRLIGQ